MPKKQNVTSDALKALVQRGDDLTMDLMYMSDDIRGGYVDRLENPQDSAKKLATLASHAAALSAAILLTVERHALEDEVAKLRKTA